MRHYDSQVIANTTSADLTVRLEPHGADYVLRPRSALKVVAESDQAGSLDLEPGARGSVTIHAWPGATCRVYLDGQLLHAYNQPVPPAAKGITTRTFITTLLGQGKPKGKP